jgi:hypothetical protein
MISAEDRAPKACAILRSVRDSACSVRSSTAGCSRISSRIFDMRWKRPARPATTREACASRSPPTPSTPEFPTAEDGHVRLQHDQRRALILGDGVVSQQRNAAENRKPGDGFGFLFRHQAGQHGPFAGHRRPPWIDIAYSPPRECRWRWWRPSLNSASRSRSPRRPGHVRRHLDQQPQVFEADGRRRRVHRAAAGRVSEIAAGDDGVFLADMQLAGWPSTATTCDLINACRTGFGTVAKSCALVIAQAQQTGAAAERQKGREARRKYSWSDSPLQEAREGKRRGQRQPVVQRRRNIRGQDFDIDGHLRARAQQIL